MFFIKYINNLTFDYFIKQFTYKLKKCSENFKFECEMPSYTCH